MTKELSSDERQAIKWFFDNAKISFPYKRVTATQALTILEKVWNAQLSSRESGAHSEILGIVPNENFVQRRYMLVPPFKGGWYIGFTEPFLASIQRTNHKLQKNMMKAITNLSNLPNRRRWRRIESLNTDNRWTWWKRSKSDQDLFWRYRLKKHSLVYVPDYYVHKCVILLGICV